MENISGLEQAQTRLRNSPLFRGLLSFFRALGNGERWKVTARSLGRRETKARGERCRVPLYRIFRVKEAQECDPGSFPGHGVVRGLSLLLIPVLAARVFSGFSVFFPAQKPTLLNILRLWQVPSEYECRGLCCELRSKVQKKKNIRKITAGLS